MTVTMTGAAGVFPIGVLSWLGFPNSGGAADQNILMTCDIGAGRQIKDLGAIDRRIEIEVETFQSLVTLKGGPPQAQLQLFRPCPWPEARVGRCVGSPFDFIFEETGQEFGIG